jgi:hypothetical protein
VPVEIVAVQAWLALNVAVVLAAVALAWRRQRRMRRSADELIKAAERYGNAAPVRAHPVAAAQGEPEPAGHSLPGSPAPPRARPVT